MTKEEAIKIIHTEMECVSRPDCDRLACAYCDLAMRAEDVLTAYQMALTALQTDGDCISRQAASNMLNNIPIREMKEDGDNLHMLVSLAQVICAIEQLPSVHPEEHTEERTETHACDCISRQAAIDALDNIKIPRNASWYPYYQQALTVMSRLPSAQPDNSCNGCRYDNADDGVMVMCGFCKRSHLDCYERRTDEGD